MENYLSLVKDGPCQLPPADMWNFVLGCEYIKVILPCKTKKGDDQKQFLLKLYLIPHRILLNEWKEVKVCQQIICLVENLDGCYSHYQISCWACIEFYNYFSKMQQV